jgi:BirA family transcriptional regulator, biotin operon repressor / biotin---[acetyl-CoA-carboxylase] ligase
MLRTEDLERALADAGLVAPVRADEVTGSTNATALELAEGGSPEWTLVSAGHQIAGRGRLGSTWEDGPDEALLCSFVLRPTLAPARAGLLTLLAGAALAEAARSLGAEVGCKWPNDLMTPDGKAGGILAEAAVAGDNLRHVVIGTGVNLGTRPPAVPGAATLPGVTPGTLLGRYLAAFARLYAPGEGRFAAGVLAAATAVSVTLGREVEAVRADGETLTGTAVDLDTAGGLVVDTARGTVTLAFGEVVHVRR